MRFQNDGAVFQVSDSLEPKHYLIMLLTPFLMDNIKYYARRLRCRPQMKPQIYLQYTLGNLFLNFGLLQYYSVELIFAATLYILRIKIDL